MSDLKKLNYALQAWLSQLRKESGIFPIRWPPIDTENLIEFGERSDRETKAWNLDDEEWLMLEERRFIICAKMGGCPIPPEKAVEEEK